MLNMDEIEFGKTRVVTRATRRCGVVVGKPFDRENPDSQFVMVKLEGAHGERMFHVLDLEKVGENTERTLEGEAAAHTETLDEAMSVAFELERVKRQRDELLAAAKWAVGMIVYAPHEWTDQEDADAHRAAISAIENVEKSEKKKP